MRSIFDFVTHYKLPAIRSLIQVGASVGQELELFVAGGVERALLIEPLEQPFDILAQRCAAHPGYVPFRSLIGARDGESKVLHVADNFGQSSSILEPTRHLEVYPTVKFDKVETIASFTLDTVARAHQKTGLPEAYDAIFIDVQGAELEVFKGAANLLDRARIVYSELTFGSDYKGAANYLKIIEFLDTFGFRLCEMEIDPNCIAHGNGIFYKTTL